MLLCGIQQNTSVLYTVLRPLSHSITLHCGIFIYTSVPHNAAIWHPRYSVTTATTLCIVLSTDLHSTVGSFMFLTLDKDTNNLVFFFFSYACHLP